MIIKDSECSQYLPAFLDDNDDAERTLAFSFGKQLLARCDKLYVCGSKLSEGMYGEITAAVSMNIPVDVFNETV